MPTGEPKTPKGQPNDLRWHAVLAAALMVTMAFAAVVVPDTAQATLVIFSDDFNDGVIDTTKWPSTSGASENDNCGHVSSPYALWFGGDSGRYAATRTLDVSTGGIVEFYLKISNSGGSACEYATSSDEYVILEYSTNGGASWTQIDTYTYSSYSSFTQVQEDIPAAAQTLSTQFRWRQNAHDGSSLDHWAIDDVAISSDPELLPPPEPAPNEAEASAPYNYFATPAYVVAGQATTVHFNYDVTSHFCWSPDTCPTTSEWQVRLGGTSQSGTVADGAVTGTVVASGTHTHPGTGETLIYDVLEEALLDAPAGDHYLKAAVRPLDEAGEPWKVETITITLMEPNLDADDDGIPDDLEPQVCGREIEKQIIDALGGAAGSCPSSTDWAPPNAPVTLIIPSNVARGPDADEDAFDAYVDVHYTNITVVRHPASVSVTDEGSSRHGLDPDDNNEDVPVISNECAPIDLPSGVAPGPDADNDGFPAYVKVLRSEVCADRRYPDDPVTLNPAADLVQKTVDEDDGDPNVPVVSIIEVENVPVSAWFSQDADDDGIVGYRYIRYLNLTYDRRSPSQPPTQDYWVQATEVDPDDNNRDDPVPWSDVDADKDLVPDAAEPYICLVEYQPDDIDGSCGSGLQNYDPPSIYQALMDWVWNNT